jgi:GDPmannose 4,6-dehydratase
MRVLITGISGQDGILLSNIMAASGFKVFGQTRNESNYKKNCLLFRIETQIDIVEGDLSDEKFTASILNTLRPDIIFHISGMSSVSSSFQYPDEAWSSIAGVTEILLFYIKKHLPNARLINFASSECFGMSQGVQSSSSIMSGLSPYAEAKIHSVESVKKYRKNFSLDAHNVFLFPHESHLRDERFLVGRVLNLVKKYYRDGSYPDFTFVKELTGQRDIGLAAEFMLAVKILGVANVPCDCVIGTGFLTNLSELINELVVTLGFEFVITDLTGNHRSRISSNCMADVAETKKALGWTPSVLGNDVMKSIGNCYLSLVKSYPAIP